MASLLRTPSRRAVLGAAATLFAWANLPALARAEGRDPRFLVIVLRGALDGLAAVPPVGDPNWPGLRGATAMTAATSPAALPLDALFGLNPAMPTLHRLFQARQAIVVHAVATPYRERSHFDGQDVLESGQPKPGYTDTGWLNRALAALAPEQRAAAGTKAFAVGPVVPLIVRGPAPVLSWTPRRLPPAGDDTVMRLLDLYRHTDPALAQALEERLGLAAVAGSGSAAAAMAAPAPVMTDGQPALRSPQRAYFTEAAGSAARFLARPDGPRIGALAFDGWDTHADEGAGSGRLAGLLSALDGAFAAIETEMGASWRETVVAVVTEFGRTAHLNGTQGTDHGTATVALLAGGALAGGRVVADWPGLAATNLHEGRDLRPTTDLRGVLKGILSDHLRADEGVLASRVFPGSDGVKPLSGLITG